MSVQQVHSGKGAGEVEPVPTDVSHMHLLLYDGDCPLCSSAVRFLLRIDRSAKLMFAPLRGETAHAIRSLWQERDESIILISHLGTPQERVLDKSDALLEVLRLIGRWWRILLVFSLVPASLRNLLYDVVARLRYRLRGKRVEECRVMPAEFRSRFLP
ncbi:MAG TPA: DCC1-like thiol-disulfide oxidoreductase family protein [Bacteroidota bacterium]|nr:DCC1-like thiol-disulfide oxidoreductase family protein [Bacteroidota bacterium]